jgi:hypothetical protein
LLAVRKKVDIGKMFVKHSPKFRSYIKQMVKTIFKDSKKDSVDVAVKRE